MASGCIIGECQICNEWVYEDETEYIGGIIIHQKCLNKKESNRTKIKKLKIMITQLESEIQYEN